MSYKIPKKYINKLARTNKVKYVGRDTADVIEDLEQGHKADLVYMEDVFQFASKYITLLKPEDNFPDTAKTPELFLKKLIDEGIIRNSQVNKSWQPTLSDRIKVCAVKHHGSTVYLKLVVGKETIKKSGWDRETVRYPYIVPIAVDFQNELIEVRCSQTELDKYKVHVMSLMGFANPYPAFSVPKMTKKTAEALCKILSAGIISSHIALPTTVGSIRFNGIKGIDLNKDENLKSIKEAIKSIGFPTSDTMDQEAVFNFTDPCTKIQFEVYLHVNIEEGFFKFKEEVNEAVIDHVKEALLKVTNQNTEDLSGDEIVAKVVVEEVLAAEDQVAIASMEQQLHLGIK